MKTVGVLAFQGSVIEHKKKINEAGADAREVRHPEDLNAIDAIILPGGESTCITRMLNEFQLMEPLAQKIQQGLPVWGTCAGAILLSRNVDGQPNPLPLGIVDIDIERNSYGSQLDSFQYQTPVSFLDNRQVNLIFIRAPRIHSVHTCENLLNIEWKQQQEIVAVKQNNIFITTFHPELDSGCTFHRYFIDNYIKTP
ncbi:pyridoxal 5'-phosphate synthase glutaminase subunit PdxT [Candidatus Uabimicrobium amorphum]|uniref:Pyridoxal 5'-phosphate synthase subunit PdxT n=1 Tax=Uabimicrobium amorphum TaxID=2596890 RepID=A0A5S9F395_UABAM|nr:pyridoxal 5'-phosphate synthase glutaminase subunit PdxT [Candidatus Uabimicrobium amorphum]BBM83194.1 pyridoxal 5'-phosphate synthase subunit PdxT [Candidatus Uabimicrobium amorphum]